MKISHEKHYRIPGESGLKGIHLVLVSINEPCHPSKTWDYQHDITDSVFFKGQRLYLVLLTHDTDRIATDDFGIGIWIVIVIFVFILRIFLHFILHSHFNNFIIKAYNDPNLFFFIKFYPSTIKIIKIGQFILFQKFRFKHIKRLKFSQFSRKIQTIIHFNCFTIFFIDYRHCWLNTSDSLRLSSQRSEKESQPSKIRRFSFRSLKCS